MSKGKSIFKASKGQLLSATADSLNAPAGAGKEASMPKPVGRPSKYNPSICREICHRLTIGQTMLQICRDEHMPHKDTVYEWLLDSDKQEFHRNYAKAREMQAEHLFDEMLDIAEDGSNDWMEVETKSGRIIEVCNTEHINRSRLRIDTRKFYLAKVLPKKFGEQPQTVINTGEQHTHFTTIKVDGMDNNQLVDLLTGRQNGLASKSA